MKNYFPRYTGWAVGIAAAVTMSGSVNRNGAQGTLIPSATPVPGTNGHAGPYFWANDRFLVSLKNTNTGYRPSRIDSESGVVTNLPQIPLQYSQSEIRNSWRLSPDGKRLLWAQQNGPTFRWIEGELDSGKYAPASNQPYDPYRRPTADWLPDSKRWVELTPRGGNYEYRENPAAPSIHGTLAKWWPNWRKIKGITDPMQILRVDSDRKVTVMVRQPMSYWGGEIAQIDLKSGKVKETTAPIPPNMGALGVALAPDGSRLALTLWCLEPSSGFRLLGPLLSSFGIRDQRVGMLRVLDAEGGEPKDAGTIHWSADRPRWRRSGPWQIKWTPDSQKLTFAYRDQLYTIPAP